MEMSNGTFEAIRSALKQSAIIIFPTMAGVGILANLFVILVIVVTERSRSNRTVANTFVLHLAIADVLFLVTLPLNMPSASTHGYQFSEAACQLTEALKHIAYHSSILFLTGMSVDRYMAIVHSLQSMQFRTQRNARIECAVLWIVSVLTSIPIILYATVEETKVSESSITRRCLLKFPGHENALADIDDVLEAYGYGSYGANLSGSGSSGNSTAFGTGLGYDYDSGDTVGNGNGTYDAVNSNVTGNDPGRPDEGAGGNFDWGSYDYNIGDEPSDDGSGRCSNSMTGHGESLSFRVWEICTFVLFFAVPLLIIIVCYSQIWRATAIRKVRSQKAEGCPSEQETLHTETSNGGTNNRVCWKEIQTKVTKMVLVLVTAFIMCWLPFQVWILLTLPPGLEIYDTKYCDILSFIITVLAWSNSLMNPILYSITSENFRKRAMTTFSFLRYGYRRTMRMSLTRSSRTGHGFRTEKTDVNLQSIHQGASPKNSRMTETQLSPPQTPIDKMSPQQKHF